MAKVRKRTWSNPQGRQCRAFIVDWIDNKGGRQRKQFTKYREADQFRIKIEGELSRGIYRADATRITVEELCTEFLEHCKGRMQRNERMTRKMLVVYRGHINNHILHAGHGLGARKLSQLTTSGVGDFRDALRNSGVSVVTTRKILSTLHAAIAFAISKDWVATNVAHGVRVIGPRDEGAKKVIPPSKPDLMAILENSNSDLKLKIMFAALTGLRASEQWGLRWDDVDLNRDEIHVRRRIDAYGSEGPTKSKAGVRTIPLSDALVKSLKEHKIGSRFKEQNDFVFPNSKGSHTRHDNHIKRHYRPALEAAVVSGINWHSLRHFAVSSWIEQGLPPKAIQTYAGHSSLSVTMDRYGHLFPDESHKAAMDTIAGDLLG
ncbi:site-specific integrase [Aliiroseovarius sp. S1123]|jgi:integrase|uniref:tyrosine-type recombinase/integrase n=1 Tax=Aliiroseovarius sp. S1123 TaxID=2926404 RepID=UPI001FF55BB8|nr:site-specific integrase [Aliiroseovarius sp. S1123]MCK0171475.1 site-specific integrase [Aliiroseovarius sp. S1123]